MVVLVISSHICTVNSGNQLACSVCQKEKTMSEICEIFDFSTFLRNETSWQCIYSGPPQSVGREQNVYLRGP